MKCDIKWAINVIEDGITILKSIKKSIVYFSLFLEKSNFNFNKLKLFNISIDNIVFHYQIKQPL